MIIPRVLSVLYLNKTIFTIKTSDILVFFTTTNYNGNAFVICLNFSLRVWDSPVPSAKRALCKLVLIGLGLRDAFLTTK